MKKNKKQRFISDKISELKKQGKNQQESIAIALSMAENFLQQGGYQVETDLDGYGLNTTPIVSGDLRNVERYQNYTGRGYGKQAQDAQKTVDTHSWYFTDDEKKKRFLEDSSKKGGSQEVRDFQEAYNKELKNRLNSSGLDEQQKVKLYNDSAFTGKGVQALDGKFGAFTSTRPMFEQTQQISSPQLTPVFSETPSVEEQTVNKPKLYKVKIHAEDMSDNNRDHQQGNLNAYIQDRTEKQGGLTEEDLQYIQRGIELSNSEIEGKYNNEESKNNPKAQERYKKLKQFLQIEELRDGGKIELPKYQGNLGSNTFYQKSYKDPVIGQFYGQDISNGFKGYDFNNPIQTPLQYPSTTYNPKLSDIKVNNRQASIGQLDLNNTLFTEPAAKTPTATVATTTTAKPAITPQLKPEVTSALKGTAPEATDYISQIQKANETVRQDSQLSDENTTAQLQRQTPPIQFANPYGGVDLNAASALFGQSLQQGDALMGVASGAKLGLGLARNFMSGYAAGKDRNRVLNDYSSNMRNAMTGAETPVQMKREGGYIFQEGGKKMQELVPPSQPPVLPDNMFKQKIYTQEPLLLKKEMQELVPPSQPPVLPDNMFKQKIYTQEPLLLKKEMQEGGTANEQDQLLQQVAMMLQQGLPPEQIMQELVAMGMPEQEAMQVIEMVMQQSQAPQQEQVPQEQQMMQEGGVATQPEVPVEMANAEIEDGEYVQDGEGVKYAEGAKHSEGGIPTQLENGARVLSDYKKVGKDLSKQFSEQLGFEVKASDTFATVLDKFNRKEGFDKKVKHLDEYSDKLEKQEKTVKHDATLALNKQILMEEAQEDTQKLQELVKQQEGLFNMLFEAQEASKGIETEGNFMQQGGTVNDLMAKYNISAEEAMKLVPSFQGVEGSSTYTDADLEFQRMKGRGYEQSNPYFFQNPGREGRLEDWTNSQMYKAEYELGDVEAKKQRFKDLADNAGVPYTEADFKDSKSIDAFSGKLQKFIMENKPELAVDYGKKVEPTRQGLQYLVDNKLINPEDYGIKMVNGKVARGSYDTLTTEADKKLTEAIANLPQDKVKDYALTNYNDNLGYFRGIKTRDQELSDEEYKKFTSENKPVGDKGYYETKVPGVYVKPTKLGETVPASTSTVAETPMEIPTTPVVDVAQDKEKNRLNFLNLPDQTPMLPWAMQAPAMLRQTIYAPRWNEISPEQQLTDIQRGRVATAEQMSFLPDSQQASSLFALDANAMAAQNKVRSETERYNQMARERTEAAEADQKTRQSAADVVAAQTYQQQLGNELESNEADWRSWYNRVASNQMNNWDSVERANLYNAYNPNVQRTSSGYEVINEPTFTNDASKKYLAEQEKKTKKKNPVAKDGGTFRGKKSTKRFGK